MEEQILINATFETLFVIINGKSAILTDEQKAKIYSKLDEIKNIINQ